MPENKPVAGNSLPDITVPKSGGGELTLFKPTAPHDWKLVIIYRGKHCPLCTSYLKELNGELAELNELGVDVAVVSADTQEKVTAHMEDIQPAFDVGYGLTIEQMTQLGLYISNPRSETETDRPFAEPGLFVMNAQGKLHIVDISNAPFARPDLKTILRGIRFIRNPDNNYPIRGTYGVE